MIFGVENHHSDAAPDWTVAARTSHEIRGYFENHHGEQWIASATPDQFKLTCGDMGWKPNMIDRPDYQALLAEAMNAAKLDFQGVVMNDEERLWLAAVLLTASRSFA